MYRPFKVEILLLLLISSKRILSVHSFTFLLAESRFVLLSLSGYQCFRFLLLSFPVAEMKRQNIGALTASFPAVSRASVLSFIATTVLMINSLFGQKLSGPSLVLEYCDLQEAWLLKESDVAT